MWDPTDGDGMTVEATHEVEFDDGRFLIGNAAASVEVRPNLLGGWDVGCTQHGRLTTRADHGRAKDYAVEHMTEHRPEPIFEAPELPSRAQRWVDGYLDRIAAKAAAGHYRDAMAEAHGLTLQLHSMALLGPKGVDAIPVDPEVGDDAPAGAGYAVEAERG